MDANNVPTNETKVSKEEAQIEAKIKDLLLEVIDKGRIDMESSVAMLSTAILSTKTPPKPPNEYCHGCEPNINCVIGCNCH